MLIVSKRLLGTLRVRRLRTTQPVVPLSTDSDSAMISSTHGAEREHRPQRLAAVLDLVDGEVVVRQQGLQVVRDPPQRVLQASRRPGSRLRHR